MITRLRASLARNLGLWLVGALILALAIIFALAYRAFRYEAAQQLIERDGQLAVLSAARLRADLENFADLLDAVARNRDLPSGTLTEQRAILEAAAPRLRVFDGGVVLLNSHGTVRAALPRGSGLIGDDWSDRDFFRELLGEAGVFISDAQPVGPQDETVVAVAVPIRGEASEFDGALAGLFRLGEPTQSALYAGIVRLRLGQSGAISIIDGQGRIVYDSNADRIGHFISGAELPLISNSEVASAELTQNAEGTEILVARAPVPRTNWTLVNQANWASVTEATRRYRNILFLAFGAALLLPPLSLALITRQRRFRFLEVRRPEHDDAWARVARDYLHPKQWPVLPGWNIVGRGSAGKRSEHEFIDSILLPDGRLMLSIGVIRAQGLQAALAITSTRTVLRACGQRLALPDDSLRQCGTSLCLQFEEPVEVRCTVMHLDPRTGWLDFACAGTSPLEAHGDRILQIPATVGDPMGLTPTASFEVGRVRIEPGHVLVVLGPSMAETRDPAGRSFLQEPLNQVLEEERLGLEDLTERIFRNFKVFRARSPLFDPDLTVITLERPLAEKDA